MIIKSVRVKNFRSLYDAELQCDQLTALIGVNGAGKSSFLRALELFYSPSPQVDVDDCYDAGHPEITIGITFTNLSEEAELLFSNYIQGKDLTVERIFSWAEGKLAPKYHGSRLQHTEFQAAKSLFAQSGQSASFKAEYTKLQSLELYAELLLSYTNKSSALQALSNWEQHNIDQCVPLRDDGQFFGFKEVGQGYLGRFTKFLFIPAVREASGDASEAKGSVFAQLMDLVVRSSLATNNELKKLKEETQSQYTKIIDPVRSTNLSALATLLTDTLRDFAPNASVDIDWLPLGEIDLPVPKADIRLVEDGYKAPVAKTGHGLQRAFIVTMLEHLAKAQTQTTNEAIKSNEGMVTPSSTPTTALPDLILAIEEPELYQHPSRQRHIATLLMRLATGKTPGVADKTQILYATHSPLFVGIDRINQLRLLRKIELEPAKPKITRVIHTSLDNIAAKLWEADGSRGDKYTGATLEPRLHSILTPWVNEGFFANVAVLVEGEDDRAAILGMASSMGHSLDSEGFAVIPCGGKTNLDRPALVFMSLGIPVYLVWDSDKGEQATKPEDNHRLLRIMGCSIEDWPSTIQDHFACFEKNLESTMEAEIGGTNFEAFLQECQDFYQIPKKKHAIKNPSVISDMICRAGKSGCNCATLNQIVLKIIALH